jgi:hypothetical protein
MSDEEDEEMMAYKARNEIQNNENSKKKITL